MILLNQVRAGESIVVVADVYDKDGSVVIGSADRYDPAPSTPYPKSCTLHSQPPTIDPTPNPAFYTVNPLPLTPPQTLHPEPSTPYPRPYPKPCALHYKPYTLTPTPLTLSPNPQTPNPQPSTPKQIRSRAEISRPLR